MKISQAVMLAVLAAAALSLTGCEKLRARDHLSKGVQAYKNGKYETAIEQFQQAVQHDPNFLTAKLYLAAAYANQVQQDVTTDENMKNAQRAIDAYQEILRSGINTKNTLAAYKQLQSIYWKIKKPDEAKQYAEKALQLDPNDPDTLEFIGIVDWYYAYKNAQEFKRDHGLDLDAPEINHELQISKAMVKDPKLCDQLKAKNEKYVTEGLERLQQAIQLRPDDDNAWTYLNLLYRRKADLDCGNEDAYRADVGEANKAVDKAIGLRKQKELQQQKSKGGQS